MSTTVYAETSAVLAWLFRESGAAAIRQVLDGAERVVSSRLTLVECARALHRARRDGRLSEVKARAAQHFLDEAIEQWVIMDIVGDLVTRAGQPFPVEPVRTPDALHLASALVFHQALGALSLLTLDERVADNARALGLDTVPG